MMKSVGVILMTALIPTVGHEYLVEFAKQYLGDDGILHVIVSSRAKEPIPGLLRLNSFRSSDRLKLHLHEDNNAPQNPRHYNDDEFWNYWKTTVETFVVDKVTHVFASEAYGQRVADTLESEFIPVDINRSTFNISGTSVRENLFWLSDKIKPEFMPHLKTKIVLFGQESTGKTTLAKALAAKHNGIFLSEWARPYLEFVGSESTPERMLTIVHGQYAAMKATDSTNKHHLLTFRDTDLLSTLGFYRDWNMEVPEIIYDMIRETVPDLYIVSNDGIPFEKDVLRYGGNVRETDMSFWIDLLQEFDFPYHVLKSTDKEGRIAEAERVIFETLPGRNGVTYDGIKKFVRE